MISRQQVTNIVNQYDLENITIGTIGSHSALDIMDGAKDGKYKDPLYMPEGSRNSISAIQTAY